MKQKNLKIDNWNIYLLRSSDLPRGFSFIASSKPIKATKRKSLWPLQEYRCNLTGRYDERQLVEQNKKKLHGLRPQANYTDRATVVSRRSWCHHMRIEGCRVVSVMDPLRLQSRLSRPKPLLFLSSSSTIVLTKLNGPRSRPTTSQKIW
jgi:hypothetical protein